MRLLPLAIAIASALSTPATAQDLTAELGARGLAATEARLAALPAPSDADRFALGGVRFLAAVEGALQKRWQAGLTDRTAMIPFLRLPLAENPAPSFDPGVIAALFRDVGTGMDAARAPLSQIPDTADFGVTIDLADLWFDVNANTTRDPGEDLLEVAGPMILGWRWTDRDPATPAPVIRFDAADAAWLSAYTHLLAGLSEVILAYDPTAAITRVTETRAALDALRSQPVDPYGYGMDASFGEWVDVAFVVIDALNQPPDATRAAAAHAHLLAMVADNRSFWARVATETDNAAEWLPNDAQQSALGIVLPPGTGPGWLAVLDDLQAILTGDLLIPYWKLDAGAGVNVGAMFTDPRPIDLAAWVQGSGALPYLQKGPLADGASLNAFDGLVQGETMLLSLFLN